MEICLSNKTGRRETGRQLDGLAVSEDFGMGKTEASFLLLGNVTVKIDRLNSLVTGAAMLAAVAFNIRPEILSGLFGFEISIVSKR